MPKLAKTKSRSDARSGEPRTRSGGEVEGVESGQLRRMSLLRSGCRRRATVASQSSSSTSTSQYIRVRRGHKCAEARSLSVLYEVSEVLMCDEGGRRAAAGALLITARDRGTTVGATRSSGVDRRRPSRRAMSRRPVMNVYRRCRSGIAVESGDERRRKVIRELRR